RALTTAAVTPEKRRQEERRSPGPWKIFPLDFESPMGVRPFQRSGSRHNVKQLNSARASPPLFSQSPSPGWTAPSASGKSMASQTELPFTSKARVRPLRITTSLFVASPVLIAWCRRGLTRGVRRLSFLESWSLSNTSNVPSFQTLTRKDFGSSHPVRNNPQQ